MDRELDAGRVPAAGVSELVPRHVRHGSVATLRAKLRAVQSVRHRHLRTIRPSAREIHPGKPSPDGRSTRGPPAATRALTRPAGKDAKTSSTSCARRRLSRNPGRQHDEALFSSAADRHTLDDIIADVIDRFSVRVHAYCWMTNQLYLLAQVAERPPGHIMQRIAVRDSRFRHKQLRTTGHLFERPPAWTEERARWAIDGIQTRTATAFHSLTTKLMYVGPNIHRPGRTTAKAKVSVEGSHLEASQCRTTVSH